MPTGSMCSKRATSSSRESTITCLSSRAFTTPCGGSRLEKGKTAFLEPLSKEQKVSLRIERRAHGTVKRCLQERSTHSETVHLRRTDRFPSTPVVRHSGRLQITRIARR